MMPRPPGEGRRNDEAAADERARRTALDAAYRATSYGVTVEDGELVARIGRHAPEIDRLLARRGAASGTFITGWNPMSCRTAAADNHAANATLAAALAARGIATLPHHGRGDDPAWPAEEGFFALDLPLDDALALARRFDQHAIVVVRAGEPAALHWTRAAPVG